MGGCSLLDPTFNLTGHKQNYSWHLPLFSKVISPIRRSRKAVQPQGADTQQQHSWLWLNFLACFNSNLGKKNTGWHTPQKGHHLLLHQADSPGQAARLSLPSTPLPPALRGHPWRLSDRPTGAWPGRATQQLHNGVVCATLVATTGRHRPRPRCREPLVV